MMGKRLAMLVATMALVVASCGGGTAETAGSESDALGTGIGVHGAWTVTVLNSDGSPASTTEFTNDLLPEGAVTLARLLVGDVTVGNWVLEFGGPTADDNPCFILGSFEGCPIFESQASLSGDEIFLSGDKRATKDGVVTQVATVLQLCDSTLSPKDCLGLFHRRVTSTTFDAIPVSEGQTVQVEVEISFGTLTTP